MPVELFEVTDAGGSTISSQCVIEGLRMGNLNRDIEIIAANIRNVRNINLRDDDVLLCGPPKSGTHWSFEIIHMLLIGRAEFTDAMKINGMLSYTPEAELEMLPSPRVMNTHLPMRLLPASIKAKKTKIVYVLRNPKDTAVSFYHQMCGLRYTNYHGEFTNYMRLFLDGNLPFGSWFEYVRGIEAYMETERDHVHLIHYEDLKLYGVREIKRLAKFLGVDADDKLIADINRCCHFDKMSTDKGEHAMGFKSPDSSSSKTTGFYRKGHTGDWKNHFTVADSELFDQVYEEKMADSKLTFTYSLPNGVW